MKTIQIIDLDGRPAAIAVGGAAIIAAHIPAALLAHVQAKGALRPADPSPTSYPAPYTDTAAEHYALAAAAAPRRSCAGQPRGSA
ncbi:MAG TPA: hypothetical protein VGO80_10885 [Solirubrobacteraceae bacterium]|jgi:hypothetical protein|nr:hypothetical protein [Solirubrobacteraceae bacterium]